jgi:hypothetical protein
MRLNTDQMRALRLLDEAGPRGCTETVMLAHGFTRELLVPRHSDYDSLDVTG